MLFSCSIEIIGRMCNCRGESDGPPQRILVCYFCVHTFSVDPLTITTTFLSCVIFWRLLNGRFDFFLLLLLLFSKTIVLVFMFCNLLFKDIFEETPDKDRFVGDVMFWKFFEDIDANRIYHTNSVEYRTHWSWCSLRGKCRVLFAPLFVFFVDFFFFGVLYAGIWRWCSSKPSSTWCYCIFAWQICGLKVLLQSQVRRALHGARVPATQGLSHSLCLQLAIAGQGFFFLKQSSGVTREKCVVHHGLSTLKWPGCLWEPHWTVGLLERLRYWWQLPHSEGWNFIWEVTKEQRGTMLR